MDDVELRAYLSGLPVPEFPAPAWVQPPPLAEATVGLVTTGGVHRVGAEPFSLGDAGFRTFASDARDLALGHRSPSYDRIGFAADVNVVVPVDRLAELAAGATIGAVAPRHVSFVGSQPDGVETVRHESGPAAAALLRDDGVDVVVLTGVGPMCTRTEGVLAHVLEAHGIATVVLVAIGRLAERMGVPRALAGELPLGRPLGRPGDPEYQHRLLRRALALLDAGAGPVLDTWPDPIGLDPEPLVVPLPVPAGDNSGGDGPDVHDEIAALREAYARYRRDYGRTSVGLGAAPEQLDDVVDAFTAIAAGTPWRAAGLPGNAVACALDLRTYYEEAALMLVNGVPGPGAAERWFYGTTASGRTLRAARRALREAEAPFPIWYYLTTAED